jgi:integrase
MQETITNEVIRVPWNKGMIMGQKPPLKRNEIWAIRIHLQIDDRIRDLAIIMQRKTRRPVQFEITDQTQIAIRKLITRSNLESHQFLFSSRRKSSRHLSTRQYAKLLKDWVAAIGLDPRTYGTHSLRRTKATLIYRRTKNLRAVQLLLGHAKLESTVRYLGIELDDALEIAEKTEI